LNAEKKSHGYKIEELGKVFTTPMGYLILQFYNHDFSFQHSNMGHVGRSSHQHRLYLIIY
jgi:ABC-type metal ion transport system substrate-binding protein